MPETNKIPDFSSMGKVMLANAPRFAAVESEKFFRESFVKQGFTDRAFAPWKKTENPLAGKRTLFRTGTLQRSIRKKEVSKTRVVIEADSDYAEIHNEGGTITVTVKMKKYFWYKYYQLAGIDSVKTAKTGKVSKSKKAQTTNAKAEFCKRMALLPVGTKIKINKTQFMGESATMMRQFDTWWRGQIDVIFKQNT